MKFKFYSSVFWNKSVAKLFSSVIDRNVFEMTEKNFSFKSFQSEISSHFSLNVWKYRLMNTVMASFHTTVRQMTKMFQRKRNPRAAKFPAFLFVVMRLNTRNEACWFLFSKFYTNLTILLISDHPSRIGYTVQSLKGSCSVREWVKKSKYCIEKYLSHCNASNFVNVQPAKSIYNFSNVFEHFLVVHVQIWKSKLLELVPDLLISQLGPCEKILLFLKQYSRLSRKRPCLLRNLHGWWCASQKFRWGVIHVFSQDFNSSTLKILEINLTSIHSFL